MKMRRIVFSVIIHPDCDTIKHRNCRHHFPLFDKRFSVVSHPSRLLCCPDDDFESALLRCPPLTENLSPPWTYLWNPETVWNVSRPFVLSPQVGAPAYEKEYFRLFCSAILSQSRLTVEIPPHLHPLSGRGQEGHVHLKLFQSQHYILFKISLQFQHK